MGAKHHNKKPVMCIVRQLETNISKNKEIDVICMPTRERRRIERCLEKDESRLVRLKHELHFTDCIP
jgi:hypothetical protein